MKHILSFLEIKSLLLFVFFSISLTINSQDKKALDIDVVNKILNLKPDSFFKMDSIFKRQKNKKDPILLLLKKTEESNFILGEAYARNLLGKYYRNKSLFKEAILEHQKTIELSKKANNLHAEIDALNMIGVAYRRQGTIRYALDYHQAALKLANEIENPSFETKTSISVSQNSIGNIYLLLKQYQLALDQFSQSIILQKEVNNKLGLAINYQNIGFAYENMGNLEEALRNYKASLKNNIEIRSRIGKVICNNSIGSILIKKGKYAEALKTIEPMLPLSIEVNDKYYLSNTYINLGWVQLKMQQNKKAEKNLSIGLKLAKEYNIQTNIVLAYQHLADLSNLKKNYKEAYTYYKLSKDKEAEVFNEKNLLYVNDLILKYDNERKTNEIKNLEKQNEIANLELTKNWNLFLFSIGIIALGIIVLFYFTRNRAIRYEKNVLTLKRDALQSQMNPHFLFNALNSIKLYIINNDQRKATSYLNKFSKLMRKILEGSSLRVTSLSEEIETLNLYMSIENIRFSYEIDFQVIADPSLNLDTIKVPPLALQPFIENAIWHGLSTKKKDKKITLKVTQSSKKFINIIIEDNGIGRKAAAKIKANKSALKKSIGIELSKERLKNYLKSFKNSFSMVFEDVTPKAIETGTRVILKIPTK